MKVINLNSKYDLTKVQVEFAETVMSSYSSRGSRFDFGFLVEKIPVFLINEAAMEMWERENRNENSRERRSERPSTEWLGMYMSKCNVLGVSYPVIALCPERIVRCVRDDKGLCWLVAKVLIHEFSHAAMDQSEYGHYDKFHEWMEEPMANLLTLCVAEYYMMEWPHRHSCRHYSHFSRSKELAVNGGIYDARGFYDFVLNFVRSQPDNYKIAADLHTEGLFNDSECDGWARHKEKWSKCTWQKQLWLDYWEDVLSGKSKYDHVVAYEIWKTFDSMDYKDFKKVLEYFQLTMKEASNGNLFSNDKIEEDMRMIKQHLYGDFCIVLDRNDWRKSYIDWIYDDKECEVKLNPCFNDSNKIGSFEFFHSHERKNYLFWPNSLGLNNPGAPNEALVCFLDIFTEASIRSIFKK